MKKIITGAFVLALSIGAAQAQTTSTDTGKNHKKEHKMRSFDKLNLTADQKAKMKSLHEEQKKEMEALKKNGSVTKEQKMELHKKYKDQMQAILTADQKAQLAKIKEERKAAGKTADFKKGQRFNKKSAADSTRMGRKGDFKRGSDFQKELNLTQDQKDKMAKIRTDFKSQFENLRNDNSLSKEDKQTKMRELMKAQQEQMKTVLTKEQIEKMQSLRKEHLDKKTK